MKRKSNGTLNDPSKTMSTIALKKYVTTHENILICQATQQI